MKSKTTKNASATRKALLQYITETPGATQETLIKVGLEAEPEMTEFRIKKTLSNMKTADEIRSEGIRGRLKFYLFDVKTPAAPASSAPKAAIAHAAPVTSRPAPGKPQTNALRCAFNLDGSLVIGRGEDVINLDPVEALHVMQFCSHQLPFANCDWPA